MVLFLLIAESDGIMKLAWDSGPEFLNFPPKKLREAKRGKYITGLTFKTEKKGASMYQTPFSCQLL